MDLLIKIRNTVLLLTFLTLVSCKDSNPNRTIGTDSIESPASLRDQKDQKLPRIEFDQTEVSTGKITQGEVRNFTFNFTNTGDAPLVISEVSGSCGCTIPRNYPKDKIMPGEGGSIDVEFDSDNKWGSQTVTVNVATNAIPAFTQLIIRTEIVVPDNMKTNN